jgi:uncharacterized repeat protein (TIGR02543 family)
MEFTKTVFCGLLGLLGLQAIAPTHTHAGSHQLTLEATPLNAGYVSGQGSYLAGTQAILTATPATGFEFLSWEGDVATTQNPLTITVDNDISITAKFGSLAGDPYTVSVSPNPIGAGFVVGGGSYHDGQQATLTATPASGFVFSAWEGDSTNTSNPLTITVNKDLTISAVFSLATGSGYAVSVATEPEGSGFVNGGGAYLNGGTATLTATPAEGFKFTGWSTDASGTENPLDIVVSKNLTITANFAFDGPPQYDLNLSINPDGHGFVKGGGTFLEGEEAT